jgi:hypothetical protein
MGGAGHYLSLHIQAVSKKGRNYHHKLDDMLAIHSSNASFIHFPMIAVKKQKGLLDDNNKTKKDLLVS